MTVFPMTTEPILQLRYLEAFTPPVTTRLQIVSPATFTLFQIMRRDAQLSIISSKN